MEKFITSLKQVKFRNVQNRYHDKGSMDKTPNEYKVLSSLCCIGKYHPLTIDMTKDNRTGRYCLE